MLTLLTVTGDRHEAFALCERWMARQVYPIDRCQWIVVDDGKEPTRCTMGQEVIRMPAPEHPDASTFCAKFIAAIDSGLIRGDNVLFIEDDDWYAPHYLSEMMQALWLHHIAGEGMACYYHVGLRGVWRHHNEGHASLCQTGIRSDLLPLVREIAETGTPFIDKPLWRRVLRNRNLWLPENWKNSLVGIKGMPGRAGLGSGHQPLDQYAPDHDLRVLRMLMGDEAEAYAKFVNPAWVNA